MNRAALDRLELFPLNSADPHPTDLELLQLLLHAREFRFHALQCLPLLADDDSPGGLIGLLSQQIYDYSSGSRTTHLRYTK